MDHTPIKKVKASQIQQQVLFSFTPAGPVCLSGHRYISPGKDWRKGSYMKFCYYTTGAGNRMRAVKYYLNNAQKRLLYLRDINGMNYRQQSQITIIE